MSRDSMSVYSRYDWHINVISTQLDTGMNKNIVNFTRTAGGDENIC